jgi:glyoxylate reductase
VTEPEPLAADAPLVQLPNCLVVPHIASASRVTRGKMADIAARNLIAGLKGEALPAGLNNDALGQGRTTLPRDW